MSFFSRLRGSRSSPAPSATGGPDASAAADAARPDDGARVRTVRLTELPPGSLSASSFQPGN